MCCGWLSSGTTTPVKSKQAPAWVKNSKSASNTFRHRGITCTARIRRSKTHSAHTAFIGQVAGLRIGHTPGDDGQPAHPHHALGCQSRRERPLLQRISCFRHARDRRGIRSGTITPRFAAILPSPDLVPACPQSCCNGCDGCSDAWQPRAKPMDAGQSSHTHHVGCARAARHDRL